MREPIDAIFDNGVLRPLVPLSLPDQARVKVIVDVHPDREAPVEPQDEWERQLVGIAKHCGVSLSNTAVSSEGLYE